MCAHIVDVKDEGGGGERLKIKMINEYQEKVLSFPRSLLSCILPSYHYIDCNLHLISRIQDESTDSHDSVNARHVMSLLLEPRSLLILTEDLYKNYLHGIGEKKHDSIGNMIQNLDFCQAKFGQTIERSTRISLTIRHVPKTLKVKLKIGK